eukprot:Awhi_evm1s15284
MTAENSSNWIEQLKENLKASVNDGKKLNSSNVYSQGKNEERDCDFDSDFIMVEALGQMASSDEESDQFSEEMAFASTQNVPVLIRSQKKNYKADDVNRKSLQSFDLDKEVSSKLVNINTSSISEKDQKVVENAHSIENEEKKGEIAELHEVIKSLSLQLKSGNEKLHSMEIQCKQQSIENKKSHKIEKNILKLDLERKYHSLLEENKRLKLEMKAEMKREMKHEMTILLNEKSAIMYDIQAENEKMLREITRERKKMKISNNKNYKGQTKTVATPTIPLRTNNKKNSFNIIHKETCTSTGNNNLSNGSSYNPFLNNFQPQSQSQVINNVSNPFLNDYGEYLEKETKLSGLKETTLLGREELSVNNKGDLIDFQDNNDIGNNMVNRNINLRDLKFFEFSCHNNDMNSRSSYNSNIDYSNNSMKFNNSYNFISNAADGGICNNLHGNTRKSPIPTAKEFLSESYLPQNNQFSQTLSSDNT